MYTGRILSHGQVMVMALNVKMSYHKRLFLLLLGFTWLLVVCFVTFQYFREKQYKVEKLDSQLQLYNAHLIDALRSDSIDFIATIAKQRLPLADLRVSVINVDGTLMFDNTLDSLPGESHLDRHEISQAMASGKGFTLRRHSASTDNTYFYSATKNDDVIVRSAVPYSVSLQEILDADRSFLWFMVCVTIVVSIVGYYATRRIGNTITRLNLFAEKAEKGERISDVESFPHDELGSISNHIVRLYARLQHTVIERDNEHRKAMHEQQERMRIKKQLTNNINHELKTPVASIKVCLETLLDHRDLPAEKHWDFIERCYANAERLTNLLNDVSAITRMDDGAANISKEPVPLDEIFEEIGSTFSEQLRNANMCMEVDVPHGIVINGNRTFISSIFRNLIDNAIAYSGGSKIKVSLDQDTDSDYTFSVSDNGVGIPQEHLERIFERFYRIDKGRSRLVGGTGLGLAIVRNAIQLHGGKIYAVNQAAGGVKFVFTLRK